MNGAAIEEEIGDDIWKGDQARKFEMMRHGRAFFQYIIGAKEIIKSFMQREGGACVWGYCDGSVLWCVVYRWHGASKWVWVFLSAEERFKRRRAINISWAGSIFLGVAAWWRESSLRQSIPRSRVVP